MGKVHNLKCLCDRGEEGWDHGVHEWAVKLITPAHGDECICVGICQKGNQDQHLSYTDDRKNYGGVMRLSLLLLGCFLFIFLRIINCP